MVISDNDAIHYILDGLDGPEANRFPRFVCYMGAGASCEAGVKSAWQICDQIRERLAGGLDPRETKRLDNDLDWNEPSLRYMSCIRRAYPDPSMRVEYFRSMLRGIGPSFAHYALALLIRHRYLKSTCVTTNFDKLVESAFIQQGESECQPIRNDPELKFFLNRPDQRYIIKLHGDYDTHNILNTSDETVIIGDDFKTSVANLLTDSGLVVLGTAGFEKSVHTLFDHLSSPSLQARNVLRFGLVWGVYMGRAKPATMSPAEMERLVLKRVKSEVSSDIARMIKRTHAAGRLFRFFPVWGAGRFLYDLIHATGNRELAGESVLYLDREMRLRQVFLKAGLSDSAVDAHLKRLEPKRTHKSSRDDRSPHEEICRKVLHKGLVQLRILYGDITKRTFMASPEFADGRRAIVSPDDTFITAGGGVAEGILMKAGRQYVLNEVAKFVPVPRGSVVVTSAGTLPVHYIFHASAIEVRKDASYSVSTQSVREATTNALQLTAALDVRALWVPLMGTGLARLEPASSLKGILEAVKMWKPRRKTSLLVHIFKHSQLEKNVVERIVRRTLPRSS